VSAGCSWCHCGMFDCRRWTGCTTSTACWVWQSTMLMAPSWYSCINVTFSWKFLNFSVPPNASRQEIGNLLNVDVNTGNGVFQQMAVRLTSASSWVKAFQSQKGAGSPGLWLQTAQCPCCSHGKCLVELVKV